MANVTKAAKMRPAAMAPMKEESVNWSISILITVHKFRITLGIIRLELKYCCSALAEFIKIWETENYYFSLTCFRTTIR
jgi:hypothetical protein